MPLILSHPAGCSYLSLFSRLTAFPDLGWALASIRFTQTGGIGPGTQSELSEDSGGDPAAHAGGHAAADTRGDAAAGVCSHAVQGAGACAQPPPPSLLLSQRVSVFRHTSLASRVGWASFCCSFKTVFPTRCFNNPFIILFFALAFLAFPTRVLPGEALQLPWARSAKGGSAPLRSEPSWLAGRCDAGVAPAAYAVNCAAMKVRDGRG